MARPAAPGRMARARPADPASLPQAPKPTGTGLPAPLGWPARLRAAVGRLHREEGGAVIMVVAICLLALMGMIGLGIDYWSGLSTKRRLDAAADAAAIAAITTAQNYVAANSATQVDPGLTTNAIAAGKAAAARAFPANAGSALALAHAVPAISLVRTAQTFTAGVTYTGSLATAFGKLFSTPTLALAGAAGSSVSMGSYLDFYLALDVSGSMGLPTSADGQATLARYNTDDLASYPSGCQFACHFKGSAGYGIARQRGVALRVDSVAAAVTNVINTATNTRTMPNQYRIGIYPFIVHAMQAAALSSDYTVATTVMKTFADTYLDTGMSNIATRPMGSGGTHFENLFNDLYTYAKVFGDGSSASSPKPFLFIVTDGADNAQTYDGSNWTGSQPQRPNNFGLCQQAQAIGVTVSILYIPYGPIQNPNPSFAGNEDGKVNAVIQYIPDDLKACASPGFFFVANSAADINNAMQAMFAQALRAARLTQ